VINDKVVIKSAKYLRKIKTGNTRRGIKMGEGEIEREQIGEGERDSGSEGRKRHE
jgi:hypothetical protein